MIVFNVSVIIISYLLMCYGISDVLYVIIILFIAHVQAKKQKMTSKGSVAI